MNYWLGVGLLFLAVGTLFFSAGRAARRRGIVLDGSAGAGVVLGYILMPVGVVFATLGVVETVR